MAKKNLGKRTLALLMSFIMIFSMVNIGVLAAAEDSQLIRNYEDTYYKQNGTAGTANDWEIHLSKQAAATQTDNVYDITLKVETKDTSVQLVGATHGAASLVLDVSNSMNYRYEGCTACGEDEGHSSHHAFDEAWFIISLGFCRNCFKGESAHADGHEYGGDSDTHLENLQAAVSEFLDSYVADMQTGDKRLVSVAVFGTDAVTIQNWIDVADATALSNVKSLVNSLSTGDGAYLGKQYLTNGGTNLEAGLALGRNLLGDTSALAGVPVGNQSLILFSDGAPTAKVKDVNDTSTTKVVYGGNDTGTQTDKEDYDNVTGILGQIAATTIAVQYNFEDTYNTLSGFDRVVVSTADTLSVDLEGEAGKVVTTQTVPTVITDPMGAGVTLLGENENYANGAWNLSGFTPAVSNDITTYTITYQVQIDPTKVAADTQYEGHTILTPANGVTTLDYTVGENKIPVEAQFNVPDIRGILPRFGLTVNYVDEQGAAIAGQIVETGILYGEEYSTQQKAIEGYTFETLAQGSDAVSGIVDADKVVTYVYSKNHIPKYTVTYEYTGETPEGAPAVPTQAEYEAGERVVVAAAPALEGYTFSGWDKENFEMPAENVVIQGHWTKSEQPPVEPPAINYTVSYRYTGQIPQNVPAVPAEGKYVVGAEVTVAHEPELSGYTFSGWSTDDVTVENGKFVMPEAHVVLEGAWTQLPPPPPATGTLTITKTTNGLEDGDVLSDDISFIIYRWEENGVSVLGTVTYAQFENGSYTTQAEVGRYTVDELVYQMDGYRWRGRLIVYDKDGGNEAALVTANGNATVDITNNYDKLNIVPQEKKYNVTYEYTGIVPVAAPGTPGMAQYAAGGEVGVAQAPTLNGYTFSGWVTDDVTVENGGFTMPAGEVVFRGQWTRINNGGGVMSYPVTYAYTGNVPAGAPSAPGLTRYTAGTRVNVAMAPELEGYNFSGWSTDDVSVEHGAFAMPAKRVELVGSWARVEIPEAPEASETPVTPDVPAQPHIPVQPDQGGELVDLPGEEPPLADLPGVELSDEWVPLADLPQEDVPLADVPKTGDLMPLYLLLALLSGVGLGWLVLSDRKRQVV